MYAKPFVMLLHSGQKQYSTFGPEEKRRILLIRDGFRYADKECLFCPGRKYNVVIFMNISMNTLLCCTNADIIHHNVQCA